ncbi:AMP-binding protein [Saccharopolyspora sp. NFXS83]|uniref:AMP-binding protein n=1 Tax=Saccharopolyspora sp. NFXS83 TaxID=2993560 RepID=UPI00224B6B29|nr:AMP-binding protein [Saccharopolyspora sp. NFXS83]MCX2730581.1 AMP-binding protein [Saccharopolyspora sp. NFXS83]
MPTSSLNPSAHIDTFCRNRLPAEEDWPELLFDSPELRYPAQLNAGSELLDTTIARYGPARPALRAPAPHPVAWTYGELRDRAAAVAAALTRELGVVPGNRVILHGPNTPWLAAAWLGVLKAGAVAVTTTAMLRPGELATVGGLTRPTVALCDHRFAAALASAGIAGMPIVPFGGDGADDLAVRATRQDPFDDVPTSADDVALLACTSGTTGEPKVTMHFHRDLLAIADTFAHHVVALRPDDLVTGTPPFAFTFGLGGLLVFPLRAGAAALLLERATPEELAAHVAENRATALFTAPTAYRALAGDGRPERLASLRRCVSAGEPLPASVWHGFHAATGIRVIDGIGSTEMLHVFVSAADDDIRPGATGRAVPGYRVDVVDDLGRSAPDGVAGHLVVRGPTGCRYLDGRRQREYVVNGWNRTGDIYVRDADGRYWFQARSDDLIITAGYNVAGPEVEQALLQHPSVADCAVVGTPDAERGHVVTAHVVLRQGETATAAELQAFAKGVIAPYKYPRRIHFVDALPRSSTGKLQRSALREAV